MISNIIPKTDSNCSSTLSAIAAAINGPWHESLCNSPYDALYGHQLKIFNAVPRSASKIPGVNIILNKHEETRMEVDIDRKHTTFDQTVQAKKFPRPWGHSCLMATKYFLEDTNITPPQACLRNWIYTGLEWLVFQIMTQIPIMTSWRYPDAWIVKALPSISPHSMNTRRTSQTGFHPEWLTYQAWL